MSLTDVVDELLKGYAEPDVDPAQTVETIADGRWLVPGRLGIRDWVAYLPDDARFIHTKRANTIGGLVMVLLGRVPHKGDAVRFGGATLKVAQMHGRSVHTVEVFIDSVDGIDDVENETSTDGGAV
ncbi:MAG: hypothetical protein JKY96_02535 [Phycisphaerales bacterium]|nr:hypothetical protein [Phycisphaerales bacterium]